jgi:hypothetical protein
MSLNAEVRLTRFSRALPRVVPLLAGCILFTALWLASHGLWHRIRAFTVPVAVTDTPIAKRGNEQELRAAGS